MDSTRHKNSQVHGSLFRFLQELMQITHKTNGCFYHCGLLESEDFCVLGHCPKRILLLFPCKLVRIFGGYAWKETSKYVPPSKLRLVAVWVEICTDIICLAATLATKKSSMPVILHDIKFSEYVYLKWRALGLTFGLTTLNRSPQWAISL